MVKKLILPFFIFLLLVIFTAQLLFAQQGYAGSSQKYSACRDTEEWPWERLISIYKGDNALLAIKKITEDNGEAFLFPDPVLADYAAYDLGLDKTGQLTYRVPDPKVDLIISFPTFINSYYNLYIDNGPELSDIPKPKSWEKSVKTSVGIDVHIHKEKILNIKGGKGFLKFDKWYSEARVLQKAYGYVIFKYSDERDIVLNYGDRIVIEIIYKEVSGLPKYSFVSVESMLVAFVESFAAYSERLINESIKPQEKKNYWQITLTCFHPDFESKQNVIAETYMPSSIHITGVVRDEDGNPISGAIVRVVGLGVSVVTDEKGRYEISVPTKGKKPFNLSGFDFILQKKITNVEIKARIGEKFVPIPSVDGVKQKIPIQIKVVDQDSKPLKKGIVSLQIVNPEKLPFVSIEKEDGLLNKQGDYLTSIITRKPEENEDYVFLKDIPLQVSFRIEIKAEEGGLLGEKEITFPLGMTILHGWTVGPDMRPRYEPEPPKIYPPKIYHLASQASPEGEFYVLARTPLDTERKAKNIYLKWTNACHLPLELLLKKPLKAGERIEVRKGKVDILTPKEHEQRIKQWVGEFLQAMGFDNGYLSKTLSNLQKLPIRYNVSGASTPHYSRGGFESIGCIDIFDEDTDYWGSKAFKGVDPPYTIFFHEMGHFVHRQMVDRWIEACLWDKFYLGAEHSTWRPPEAKTEKGKKITSFYENTADFFAYLMYKFLDQHHPEFKDSIYYDPGYLEGFDKTDRAMAALPYGGCRVEGIQTTFLRKLYGHFGQTAPARVFGDYLQTMDSFKEESWILKWVPARNIEEWVEMKRKYKGMQEGNLDVLAQKFRVIGCDTGITAYAQGNLTIKINQNLYQLKEGINGTVNLTPGETVQIKEGASIIYVNDPKGGKRTYLFVKKGTVFQFLSFKEVKVIQGEVAFYGPIIIHASKSIIKSKGTSAVVKVKDNGEVVVQVVEGRIDVVTLEVQQELSEGEQIQITKSGTVKSIQKINKNQVIESFYPRTSLLKEKSSVSTASNTIKLHPSADSHVFAYSYRNWNSANWGKWEVIGVGWQVPGGEKRAYLKFNLPKVSCKRATLRLYLYNIGGSNSATLGVYRVLESWSEGTDTYHSGQVEKTAKPGEITWNNQPAFDPHPIAVFKPPAEVNRWVSVDITPLVNMWLSGRPNYGLMIKMVESPHPGLTESIYNFWSREYKDKTKWPVLEIESSILPKSSITAVRPTARNWKWSDPEGNDRYSIHENEFYLKINPYQDIWYCNRGGAGLLTTEAPSTDNWSAEAMLNVAKRRAATHTGLVIWNGKEQHPVYAIYIGLYDTERIRIEGSYSGTPTGWPNVLKGIRGNTGSFDEVYKENTVLLKIERKGYNYRFYYRPPDTRDWKMLGQIFTKDKFNRIGFIGKTWGSNSLEVTFKNFKLEYKKVTPSPVLKVSAHVELVEKQSLVDYVSQSESLRGDGHFDSHFRITIKAPHRTITWFEIRNTNGQSSVWDTKPNNGMWLIVVAYDGIVLNHSDGSFQVTLPEGERTFDLYLQDNGSIAAGHTSYKLTVGFGNGKTHSFPIISKS